MFKYFFPVRETFNAYSHLIGAIAAFMFTILLLIKGNQDPWYYQLSYVVYGITVFLMFSSSAIYHSVNVSFKSEERFRLIDHIMIYMVIAGSYTPICAIALSDNWKVWMLIGIWTFALIGIVKKIFWLNAPRWLSTFLYLLMGWVCVIIFPQIWETLPVAFSIWIAIGGLFYTIGAIIYGVQKPDPVPDKFGFHEIWHLFVIGGAFSHFWAIFYYLPGN